MWREGLIKKAAKKKKPHKPKPYEQMQFPGQHIQINVEVVPRRCIAHSQLRPYQYTAIDAYSLYRVLGAYEEQIVFASADFLGKIVTHFARKGIIIKYVQTDNGFKFTGRFSNSQRDFQSLFEAGASEQGLYHKLIRLQAPSPNGKVENSRREDQRHLDDTHRCYSLADFGGKLSAYRCIGGETEKSRQHKRKNQERAAC